MTPHDMRFFRPASILLALTAFLFTGPVHSLGLGKLSVLSALDEPLVAEIELTSVEDGAMDSLEVRLGNAEEFDQAGVARDTFLRTLEFSVVKGGTPRIRINTAFPAREPFLHFLIRATWDDGNLLREYTALLDPPLYAEKQPTAISSPGVVDEARQLASPGAPEETFESSTTMEAVVVDAPVSSQEVAPFFAGAEFGPTTEGDTLWSIASGLDTGGRDVTIFQIMIALLRENPDAFIDNNINRLMKGQILRLTDLDLVGKEEASLAFETQMNDWESFRAKAAQAADVAKVPAGQEAPVPDSSVSAATGDAGAVDKSADTTNTMAAEESGEPAAGMEEGAAAQDDLLKIVRATLEEESEGSGTEAMPLNTDSEPEKDIGMMREQLATLEESLVSAELQNQELRERVALLEQQVIKAQRLVELESQELALAQEQAAQRQEEKLLLEQQLAEMQLTAADQPAEMAQQPAAPDQPDENMVDTAATEAQDTAATEAQEGMEAEATQPEGVQPAETGQPAVVPEPQPQTTAATETADEQQPAAPATQTNTREDTSSAVVPVAAPAPAKPWWQSAIDSVQGNSFSLVAGIAGVLVLLAGIILFVRRRRSIAEFEESILSGSGLQGQTDTTDTAANKNTDTSFLSDFGMAGMGSMQADEVDPLAEAEVYLAYGRDEQAEEVLKEAATRTPERHELKLKLLEIYQQRNDLNSFETLAEELYPAGGQGDTAVWSQVVQMGTKMNPDNPLFSQPVSEDGVAASAPPDIPFEAADSDLLDALNGEAEKSVDPSQHPFPQPDEPVGIDEEFERLASQMGLSDDAAGTAAAAHLKGKGALPKEDPEMIDFASNERSELDFDIDLSGLEDQVDNKPADINKDEAASDDEELSSTDDAFSPEVHEIDLPEISDEPTLGTNTLAGHEEDEGPGSAPAGKGSEIKVGDETLVRLDSAEPNGKAPGAVDEHRDETVKDVTRSFGVVTGDGSITSDGEDESDQWDEAATKLDLAQAYLNMGDKAGARSIIDEVMKEGSPSQRDQAAELQSQIG